MVMGRVFRLQLRTGGGYREEYDRIIVWDPGCVGC